MSLLSELEELGVNTKEALDRFMNNAELYERMLRKLPKAVNDNPVKPFIDEKDYETAMANAHTLKGVLGNLSITPLYNAYTEIVALFRDDKPENAAIYLEKTLPIQQQIIEVIEKYQ